MSVAAQKLMALLPAILRIRDQSQAVVTPGTLAPADRDRRLALQTRKAAGTATPLEEEQLDLLDQAALAGPLASLLSLFGEQFAVIEEDLAQLHDDQFIETCADWVAPYIGDLIGYQPLHGVTPKIASPRAEVAHTIAYRRRKGTVVVLEQLARDVTGWNAKAVEFFGKLVMTQYMNHLRPQCLASPDVRQWEPLARLGTAFDTIMHTVDVRRIGRQSGRYNIPNVGIFLWRIDAWPLSGSPAAKVDDLRFRFSPLGIDQPLYTRPRTMDDFARLATPLDAPEPIRRRVLQDRLDDYYGDATDDSKSLRLWLHDKAAGTVQAVASPEVAVCDLEDVAGGWAHVPAVAKFAVDPVLGRIALKDKLADGIELRVDCHYGFSGPLGGGEYDRSGEVADAQAPPRLALVPKDFPSIQGAIDALGKTDGGVVQIADSGRYEEALSITAPAGKRVEVRAADRCRPTLVLTADLELRGGDDSEIRLDGLLITGAPLRVPLDPANRLARLHIGHCTLVPGLALNADGSPWQAGAISLLVDAHDVAVTIRRSVTGALGVDEESTTSAIDTIIDATAVDRVAYAAPDGVGVGGRLSLDACTVVGKLFAVGLPLVSNSLVLARLSTPDPWTSPVMAQRRQEGCVRFSYLPADARVPRRYRCLPESAASPQLGAPRFSSLRYGVASYGQLASTSGAQLLTGADNEGQPGAFNFLFEAQRATNLRMRLAEYLRAGLEAGIIHES